MNNKFFTFIKFLVLALLCILASTVIVWPLWKFSTGAPTVYTILILTIIAGLLLFFIVKKIIHSDVKKVIRFFVNLILICAGIFFSVRFVFVEKKLIALFVFLGTIAMVTVFNLIMNRIQHE